MTDTAPHRCRTAGCKTLTYDPLCRKCASAKKTKAQGYRRYDSRDRDQESYDFYHSKFWTSLAKQQKALFPYCQWPMSTGFPCLSTDRLAADHITPRKAGGLDVLANLQTLCHEHHTYKTNLEANQYFGPTTRTIVCGPPGSGKTTYVRTRITPGCAVWDMDAITRATTFSDTQYQAKPMLSLLFDIREYYLQRYAEAKGFPNVYWIEGAPTQERRSFLRDKLHGNVIVFETPPEQCKANIDADPHRDKSRDWHKLVDDWWSSYSRSSFDQVIK